WLDRYPTIYLLNVPQLSDKALKNLEDFVRDGGSVCFFLGDKVRPDYYTQTLYNQGTGIFPAPLGRWASTPLQDSTKPPDETEAGSQMFEDYLKVHVRDDNHKIFKEVYGQGRRSVFRFLIIDRYYPVSRLSWPPPQLGIEELATLPNRKPPTTYAK